MGQASDSPKYALISPTFKRPDEVTEFLQSLTALDYPQIGFEIILGDGTPGDALRPELAPYLDQLPLQIYYEEFLPVSDARNRAASLAKAQYFIFLDSDCIIPPGYLRAIDAFLDAHPDTTLFGGPDAASADFTDLQKAINFSMTSFLTTGGIRGGKSTLTSYQPRGFNMGMSAELFRAVGGYDENFVCGEDVELSLRLQKAGATSRFIAEAHVFHKRRATLKQFRRQVFRFGAARPLLAKAHPGNLKVTHLFPLVFTLYRHLTAIFAVVGIFYLHNSVFALPFALYVVYMVGVFLTALRQEGLSVALLSVQTTNTMNEGYGIGFLRNFIEVYLKGNPKGIKL
jgi:GT2 family glycosyltransferase